MKTLFLIFVTVSLLLPVSSFAETNCQKFVSSVFARYNLPVPGAVSSKFPSEGSFDIERIHENLPVFHITTTVRYMAKEIGSPDGPTIRITRDGIDIVQERRHLHFQGSVLKDGYIFTIAEIKPEPERFSHNINSMLYRERPLVHTFNFSRDCAFRGYGFGQRPPLLKKNATGFLLTADESCRFDGPGSLRENSPSGHSLRAHKIGGDRIINYHKTREYLVDGTGTLILSTKTKRDINDYSVVVEHPHYYRGLCALARDIDKDS